MEEKLQEAGPEVTAEDSTLEMFNGVQSQVADDVIDSNKIREEDKEQEAMPEHNVADSTSEKCNRAPSRVADIVINYDGVQEQDKLQDSVACTEHGFDVAESTVENLNAPSQLGMICLCYMRDTCMVQSLTELISCSCAFHATKLCNVFLIYLLLQQN